MKKLYTSHQPPKQAVGYKVPKRVVQSLLAVTGGVHGVVEFDEIADQLRDYEKQYIGRNPPALTHYRQPELFRKAQPEEQWEEILNWGGLVCEVATYATDTHHNPALRAHAVEVHSASAIHWAAGQLNLQNAVAAAMGSTTVARPQVQLTSTLGTLEWSAEAPNQPRWLTSSHTELLLDLTYIGTSSGT